MSVITNVYTALKAKSVTTGRTRPKAEIIQTDSE